MQITTQSKTAYNRKNILCDDKSPLKLITYDILHIFVGIIPYLLAIAFGLSFRSFLMTAKMQQKASEIKNKCLKKYKNSKKIKKIPIDKSVKIVYYIDTRLVPKAELLEQLHRNQVANSYLIF